MERKYFRLSKDGHRRFSVRAEDFDEAQEFQSKRAEMSRLKAELDRELPKCTHPVCYEHDGFVHCVKCGCTESVLEEEEA